MTMAIKTNGHRIDMVCFSELPPAAAADFDYVEECDKYSPRFFRYRGCWYDSNEFMRVPKDSAAPDGIGALAGFDGYQSDSYFSGIAIKYTDNFERVIAATYYC
jgi:hypothetical protein